MQKGQPSRTALAAAVHRAAHQIVEQGSIFSDPLALRILGQDDATFAREDLQDPSKRTMRLFIAVRTRFAEDALAAAVKHGVQQLGVLGAGLDTFAYRNPFPDRLRVFEVDHPATQDWKLQRLNAAGIPMPDSLTYVPVDFENEVLAEGLENAGFDCERQSFFIWLGVVPYLAEEAVWETLGFIAGIPGGAHVVFDYSDPPDSLPPNARAIHQTRAARVESLGEAWLTHFERDSLQAKMTLLGFSAIEDLGPREISSRYFPNRKGSPPERGGHILLASTYAGG
jgi:methyltransferase (TIGR00027 family)